MEMQRRLISYTAVLVATIYYLFGRAEAATPDRPTVSGQSCHEAAAKLQMIACKPQRPVVPK
jgi:hypothetical protein